MTLSRKCERKALAIGSGVLRRVRNWRFNWSKSLLSLSSFVLHLPSNFRMSRTVDGFLQGGGSRMGSLLLEMAEASKP